MSSRPVDKKSTSSKKDSSKSSAKEPSAWVIMAKKVTSPSQIPPFFQIADSGKPEGSSSKSRSASATPKQSSISVKSSSRSKYSSRGSKASSSHKVTTEPSRAKSIAKTDIAPKSERVASSSSDRKHVTSSGRSSSKAKQTTNFPTGKSTAKSGIGPNSDTNKALIVRKKLASSTKTVLATQSGKHGLSQHHYHRVIVQQHAVFRAPPPLIMEPRVICKHCRCEIREAYVKEVRMQCCFECSTRHGR